VCWKRSFAFVCFSALFAAAVGTDNTDTGRIAAQLPIFPVAIGYRLFFVGIFRIIIGIVIIRIVITVGGSGFKSRPFRERIVGCRPGRIKRRVRKRVPLVGFSTLLAAVVGPDDTDTGRVAAQFPFILIESFFRLVVVVFHRFPQKYTQSDCFIL
jgi:hypothetical protein